MASKRIVIFGWTDSIHIQKWVAGLQGRGYELKVITLGCPELKNCLTINFPRRNRLAYFYYAGAAAREALQFKPDLVHVHYISGFGLWALKTHFIPTVASVWGSDIKSSNRGFFSRKIAERLLSKMTTITATSNFLKSKVVDINPEFESKTEVIPFGVDTTEDYKPLPAEKTFRLCYIKRLRPVYGPDVMLKALALAKKTNPDILLSIAGDGEMSADLHKMVKELDLEKNVEFTGFIDNKEIYPFISKHHAVVMPSREEGFGVAALEAGICGRPIIATNVGGIPEIVINNKTGILIPRDDHHALSQAMLLLADDRKLTENLGRQGYDYVKEKYSWEGSLDKMVNLYERLIDDSKKTK